MVQFVLQKSVSTVLILKRLRTLRKYDVHKVIYSEIFKKAEKQRQGCRGKQPAGAADIATKVSALKKLTFWWDWG